MNHGRQDCSKPAASVPKVRLDGRPLEAIDGVPQNVGSPARSHLLRLGHGLLEDELHVAPGASRHGLRQAVSQVDEAAADPVGGTVLGGSLEQAQSPVVHAETRERLTCVVDELRLVEPPGLRRVLCR